MAAGKWQQWCEPENLERLTNWAANGLTYGEIAANMGVHRATLMRWRDAHCDICDALKRGRMLSCEVIENALFKRARGFELSETVEEFRGELRDGEPYNGTVVKRTTEKAVPPDTGAIIFYLKNRMPDRYSDRRVSEVSVTAPSIALGVEPGRADD